MLANALDLSQDQGGCRRLQKKIEEENSQFIESLLNILIPHFNTLMVDSFANYLCQKLIQHAKDYHVDKIL